MNIIIQVSEGNVSVTENKSIAKILASLPNGIYDISIKKHTNKRSLQQNRYYWGVVIPFVIDFFNAFGRTTPMTLQQAHVQFKDIAGLYEDVQIYDKDKQTLIEKRVYTSFSNAGDLSTIDFMNACDIVREAILILSEGECLLPTPC